MRWHPGIALTAALGRRPFGSCQRYLRLTTCPGSPRFHGRSHRLRAAFLVS